MGFFDSEVRGSFDRMFDFNRNGRLDIGERAMQFEFMDQEEREMAREMGGSYYDDDEDEADDEGYDSLTLDEIEDFDF